MRVALIATLVVALGAIAHASPGEDFDDARRSFKAKDWQSARGKLKDLLYPRPRLASTGSLADAHLLLGICHYETGNREDAKSEFEAVLSLEPDKTPEPLLFSSGALRLFDETKADIEVRTKRDAALRKIEEDRLAIEKYKASFRFYETHSYSVNFIPFGGGQFQNKQRAKGILFATGQGVSVGVSAVIFLYLAQKYGLVSNDVPLDEGPRVRLLQQLEIGSGAIAIGLYAWSVIDALIHYTPRTQIQGDESLLKDVTPKAPPSLTPQRRKTSLRDRLHLGPVLLPSGAGIGLSLEN